MAGGLRPWTRQLGSGYLGIGPTEVDDGSAESGIRGEHTMVVVAMEARWWHKASESSEEFKGREHEFLATVRCRLGQAIDEPGLWRGEGRDTAWGPEPFEREGRSSTVAEQAFDACPVLAPGAAMAERATAEREE
jgi:hypothetical protein